MQLFFSLTFFVFLSLSLSHIHVHTQQTPGCLTFRAEPVVCTEPAESEPESETATRFQGNNGCQPGGVKGEK